jgi:hypothetical protein
MSPSGPRRPIRKVDREERKERSEWRVGIGQQQQLILQKQARFEITAMGRFRPNPEISARFAFSPEASLTPCRARAAEP